MVNENGEEPPPSKRYKCASENTRRNNTIVTKSRCRSILKYLNERAVGKLNGFPNSLDGWSNNIWFSHMRCVKKYAGKSSRGAIFNIEFSPDNKFLVAACESSDIILFDPCNQRKLYRVVNAHRDSVNCVTFLDSRTFATCSDDKNIHLWDVRNLRARIVSLKGHNSWVKSITYNSKTKQLISSAFDDTIRTWDINDCYNKDGTVKSKKVLSVPYLTRTKLSPDFSQMIVATTTGYLFIIHDLNLDTVKTDTREAIRTYVSNQVYNLDEKIIMKPNRVECISEFPSSEKPWCIASLQVHPSGKNILSRYTTQNSTSEWSVIHDIRPYYESNKVNHRLHRFIEEPNLASGYIKELCYNDDGTVICSPFGNSIRLLAFSTDCTQMNNSLEKGKELVEVSFITSHKQPVLTTRFASSLPVLASGCLGGHISFYQPKF